MTKVNNNLFSQLSATQKPISQREYIPEAYKKVARGMEKQFLEFMIEQMNKTTGSSKTPSTAMNYYQALLTGKRAETMTHNKDGMGIQDIILNQIYPREKRNKLAYEAYLKAVQAQAAKRYPGLKTSPSQLNNSPKEKENIKVHKPNEIKIHETEVLKPQKSNQRLKYKPLET